MGLLSDQLHQLQTNRHTGQSTATSLSKAPVELNQNVGPTSIVDDDTFKFSSISYPRDVTQDMQNGHYMLFYINVQNKTKYIMDPQELGARIGETITTGKAGVAGNIHRDGTPSTLKTDFISYGDTNATYREGLVKKGGTGTIHTDDAAFLRKGRKGIGGFQNILPTTTRITDSIAIYLPPNVQDTTGVTYNNAEMGIIGLAAAGGTEAIKKLRRGDIAGFAKQAGSSGAGLLAEGVLSLGAEFLGTLGGVDAGDLKEFAKKAFGQATNPYMEVLFGGVEMRSFTYNFTFSPRNEMETLDVQKIIKMFRFHMLPELQGTAQRFMTLPSTFDIHYMYQMNAQHAVENSFYNKIATCVLKNCDVDYSPDGVKSFASGAPTQIKMTLTFQETEMLTKEHVDRGF